MDNKNTKEKESREKKPDLNSKPGKYFIARKHGLNKQDALKVAGYGKTFGAVVEKSKTYQAIEARYKDKLLEHIKLQEIAGEHAKVIRQNRVLAAKNTAIKMALDKIEPEENATEEGDDKLVVIFSK